MAKPSAEVEASGQIGWCAAACCGSSAYLAQDGSCPASQHFSCTGIRSARGSSLQGEEEDSEVVFGDDLSMTWRRSAREVCETDLRMVKV